MGATWILAFFGVFHRGWMWILCQHNKCTSQVRNAPTRLAMLFHGMPGGPSVTVRIAWQVPSLMAWKGEENAFRIFCSNFFKRKYGWGIHRETHQQLKNVNPNYHTICRCHKVQFTRLSTCYGHNPSDSYGLLKPLRISITHLRFGCGDRDALVPRVKTVRSFIFDSGSIISRWIWMIQLHSLWTCEWLVCFRDVFFFLNS